MLQTKMKGNLSEWEEQYIIHSLSELKLNFIDEQKKWAGATEGSGEPTGAGLSESGDLEQSAEKKTENPEVKEKPKVKKKAKKTTKKRKKIKIWFILII